MITVCSREMSFGDNRTLAIDEVPDQEPTTG